MKKILLACSTGVSTAMLVKKMKEAATEKNINIEIESVAEILSHKMIDDISVLMLGPQIAYFESHFKNKYSDTIPVATIPMMDYGLMNGKKVLEQALDLIYNFSPS